MPFESLLTNPNPPVERSRSILSRFSSPLSKRSAKLFDLEIEPEHPHKTYKPGDVVKGQIVLTVLKGFEITHLTVSLHGYARVFKHQCSPAEAKTTPEQLINGKGSHGFEYHGNGLASLFQDEQALCGLGFLKKQVYKFGFELQFPMTSLPSTIEFERGAVNYMLSATVTRNVAIGPTTTRTYKIKFEDRIDVESMYTPKSRAIFLEPMRRGGKVKKVKQTSSVGTHDTSQSTTLSRQNTSHSTRTGSSSATPLNNPPLSPAPSEDTVATNATASTHSLKVVGGDRSQRKTSDDSEPRSSTTSTSAHTISATTEISRHGALPGDLIPIRVKVEHSKAVRGIVIATLYRQGRIDMLPALPLASKTKDKKPEFEDVYPKSKTGLGGLYFTNGAPNMAFRKDLAQTSTMMIVDPNTKTADVRFSVRVPHEAFPTIDNIPGGMISFNYFLEVVIDLTGRLGESRLLPSLTTNGPAFSQGLGDSKQLTKDWANNILDTDPIRRTKNVASFELPIIVGTEDTGRGRKLRESNGNRQNQPPNPAKSDAYSREYQDQDWDENKGYGYNYDEYVGYNGYETYDDVWHDEHGNPFYDAWDVQHQQATYQPPTNGHAHYVPNQRHNVPPPEIEDHVDEKTRLRMQEELLLPSQPPDSGESSSQARSLAPSAPILDGYASQPPSSPGNSIPITISRASARSAETIVPDPLTPPPSLPEENIAAPTDDKQELERQRLMAQASAPPTDDSGAAGPSTVHAPSAPVMNDDEEYISQALRSEGNEALPQYHR